MTPSNATPPTPIIDQGEASGTLLVCTTLTLSKAILAWPKLPIREIVVVEPVAVKDSASDSHKLF